MQRRDLIAGALAWTSAAMLPTYAQGKPIRILVGFPPVVHLMYLPEFWRKALETSSMVRYLWKTARVQLDV